MKKRNLNAVPTKLPQKLDYYQVDKLMRALASDMMMAEVDSAPLMILMQEISRHAFDHSHVETIVNTFNHHLFAHSMEADRAFERFMESERKKLAESEGVR